MDLTLAERQALPDALRVLLDEYPREMWEAHPNFSGLVQFWLERHQMFRQLLGILGQDVEGVLDARLGTHDYAVRLSRYGGALLNQLHGHHQIEDHHYFPVLRGIDPRIETGFDLLDADHHAMDGLLAGFAETANAVIAAAQEGEPGVFTDRAAAMRAGIGDFGRMLERHLADEEDLIVPVILQSGGAGLA